MHRLTRAGVSAAAVTLSLAAATPALACVHGSGGNAGAHRHHASTQASASRGNSTGHGNSTGQGNDATNDAGASQRSGSSSQGAAPASDSTRSTQSGHNPPGNNGTVFIHDVAGDNTPHNVPHVGCRFYVDFFGFDRGQQVSVSFAGQAPTGMGVPLGGSWSGTVSTTDAGGAGHDFDLELPFSAGDLGVTDLGPAAHQGYHVKMTVRTGEPGGKKSKVFWIAPCASTPGGPITGGSTTGGSTTGGADTRVAAQRTTAVTSRSATAPGGATAGTQVLGERLTKAAPASAGTAAGAGSLPFTGAEIAGLLTAAAAALGGGIALRVAGRRRRAAGVSSRG